MALLTSDSNRTVRFFIPIGIIAVAIGLDFWSKEFFSKYLATRKQVNLLGDWLSFKLAYNPGAAFSFGASKAGIIASLAIIITIILFILLFITNSWLWTIALSSVIAGSLGNLLDRYLHNVVTDFISVGKFPIFNLADSFITIGAVSILGLLLTDQPLK